MALVIIISNAMPKLCGVNIVSRFPPEWFVCNLAAGNSATSPRSECSLSNLLTANSGNKELQEAIGIYIYAHFCIGLHGIDTLNHVAISMQYVALHISMAISYGFAARELSSGLNIYVHLLHLDQRWIDRHSNRRRIVHGRAGSTECLRKAHHKL